MNKLTRNLTAAAGVITLAGMGALMSSRHAAAQGGGPTVTIGGPLPLPTVSAGGTVAQHVELGCLATTSNPAFPCSPFFPDGTSSATQFTVPAGQYLIVTSVDFTPTIPGPGIDVVALKFSATTSGRGWVVPNASTSQLLFPTAGMPLGPGSQPMVTTSGNPNPSAVIVNLRGYLTSN